MRVPPSHRTLCRIPSVHQAIRLLTLSRCRVCALPGLIFAMVICATSATADTLSVTGKAGVGFESLTGDVQYAGRGFSATRLNFAKDLGVEKSESFFAEVGLRVGAFHVYAGYQPIEFDGSLVLSRPITINGTVFDINTRVDSYVDQETWFAGLEYFILERDGTLPGSFGLALGASLKVVGLEGRFYGTSAGNSAKEERDHTIPVPAGNLRAEFTILPGTSIHGAARFFTMPEIENSKVGLIELEAGIGIGMFPGITIGGELGLMLLDIDAEKGTQGQDLELFDATTRSVKFSLFVNIGF